MQAANSTKLFCHFRHICRENFFLRCRWNRLIILHSHQLLKLFGRNKSLPVKFLVISDLHCFDKFGFAVIGNFNFSFFWNIHIAALLSCSSIPLRHHKHNIRECFSVSFECVNTIIHHRYSAYLRDLLDIYD